MSVLVWIELFDGKASHNGWEVMGKGRELADGLGTELAALVIGDGVGDAVAEVQTYGPDKVFVADGADFGAYRLAAYSAATKTAIAAAGATVVLTSASIRGRELSAAVACDMDAGLAPDVIDLGVADGKLTGVRSVFSGNILADVSFTSPVQFASVRPRSFPTPEAGAARGEVVALSVDVSGVGEQVLEVRAADSSEVSLTDANIIVSGGRGVQKDPEAGFKLVADLADVLGAAVGASRAAVDAGFIPYKHQVGQTGKTVKPDLYIAAGISGAIQHLAGMGNSKVIVAINTDGDAPIFEKANYGIVDDLFTVLPALTEEFRKRLGK